MTHRLSLAIAIAIAAACGVAAPATAQETPSGAAPEAAAPTPAPAAAVPPPLRAQILLERAAFSPGELDGAWGSKSRQAMRGFQRAHGLAETGEPDDASLAALDKDTAPALVGYTITADDVAGPFVKTPDGPVAKSKMASLPYESAAEALGERFHASPALLRALNNAVPLDVAGGMLVVPNVLDIAPLQQAAKVVIDKSDGVLRLVDAAGNAYAQFPITTGSAEYPLPIGDLTIESIAPNPTYSYDPALIAGADPDGEKAQLPPGPNGPVGTMWMSLSKPHYGIHGTPDPARIGRTQSSGCVRLTNWSANAVAQAVSAGMTVSIQD